MTTKKLLKFLNDEIVPKIPQLEDVKFSNKSSNLMKKSNKNPDAPSSASTKASSAKDTPAKSVVAAPVATLAKKLKAKKA